MPESINTSARPSVKSIPDLTIEAFAHDEIQLRDALRQRDAELLAYREMAQVAFDRVAALTHKLNAVNTAYYRLREEYRQLLHGGAR
jgi:hypothetical protein